MDCGFTAVMVSDCNRHRAEESCQVHETQNDEHDSDGEFHAEADAGRNDEIEKDDRRAHNEDGAGVTYAPEGTDERGASEISLARHDSSNGDDVVRIGGMAHAEEESQRDNGK